MLFNAIVFSNDLDAYEIHMNKYETDNLYPNPNDCPYFKEYRRNLIKQDLYKTEDYKKNLELLYSALGIEDQKNPNAFTEFRDDMVAREAHSLSVPENLKPMVKKSDKYATLELTSHIMRLHFFSSLYYCCCC